MSSNKFTLIELFDLSLRVPELGAVNFNILHAALTFLVMALGVDGKKAQCDIEDELEAQLAITKGRMHDKNIKGRQGFSRASVIREIVKDVLMSEMKEKPDEEEKSGEEQSEGSEEGTEKGKDVKPSDDEDGKKAADDTEHTGESEDVSSQKKEEDTKVEESIQEEPEAKPGIQDMWKTTNINRRLDGMQSGLCQMSTIIDTLVEKLNDLETQNAETRDRTIELGDELNNSAERIRKLEEDVSNLTKSIDNSNDQTKNEIQTLEVAFNENLDKMKEEMSTNVNNTNTRMTEIQDLITPKEDFTELVSRVDTLEEVKVNREELGRFMEEGFIENFINEQDTVKTELDTLKQGVTEVENSVKAVSSRIDEELLPYIDDSLEEVNSNMETMKQKLDTLDSDDINDTFARLEDKAEGITKELETLKNAESRLEKEARVNFKKISDLTDLLNKLESSKADKSKMYDLLELKADLEVVMSKVDSAEFVSVMQDVEENIERLTNKVEVTEKNLDEGLAGVRRTLSFKMYTEDFKIATEPLRNRIKAMIYEQEEVKKLVLKSFLPDAPGVVKCFSCKRAANLTDAKKFRGKYKSPPPSPSTASQDESQSTRFPPINLDLHDLDSVPIPPADKPRITDIHKLPVLLASARPQVGLAHQKRKKVIDREIAEYFGHEKETTDTGGSYTKALPQQRGLRYTRAYNKLSDDQRYAVYLKGLDKRIYRGSIPVNALSELPDDSDEEDPKDEDSNALEQTSSQDQKVIYPTSVVLHSKSAPVPSKKFIPIPVSKNPRL